MDVCVLTITTGKAQPFEQESPRRADALCVAAPVLEAVSDELRDILESFGGAFVEELVGRGDFFEEPGFDEGAAGEHEGMAFGAGEVRGVVFWRVDVAVAEEEDWWCGGMGAGGGGGGAGGVTGVGIVDCVGEGGGGLREGGDER